jgi:hypothetical protein
MTDEQVAVSFLRSLVPGQLPSKVFHAVAGVTVTPIYEVVPVRRTTTNDVEVLLLERPADDPVWGGQLHTPGTVIRANDESGSFHSAVERIRRELNGAAFDRDPVYVETRFHQVLRGRELALIHWATMVTDPGIGTWVPVVALPDRLVDSQREFILVAAQHFIQSR